MDFNEKLKYNKMCLGDSDIYYTGTEKGMKFMEELINKITPMQPTDIIIDTNVYETKACRCPNCNISFYIDKNDGDWEYDYCPYCSQALDWSNNGKN